MLVSRLERFRTDLEILKLTVKTKFSFVNLGFRGWDLLVGNVSSVRSIFRDGISLISANYSLRRLSVFIKRKNFFDLLCSTKVPFGNMENRFCFC